MKDPKNHQNHVKKRVLRDVRNQTIETKRDEVKKMEPSSEELESVQLKALDEHELRRTKRNVHKPRRNWQFHPRFH